MRIKLFVTLFLVGGFVLVAQIKPERDPELVFPAGDSSFQQVWKRLDTLVYEGRGSLNVVHIGGSHVQAGMLTDAVRKGLHGLSPDLQGSSGWLFPYTLAGTNNPRSYKVTKYGTWTGQRCSVPQHVGPWGFAGIRAIAADSAGFSIYHREIPLQSTSVVLFYANSERVPQPKVVGPVTEIRSRPDGIEVHFARPIDTLSVAWKPGLGRRDTLSLEGVLFRPADPNGIRYHSVGVNGAATHSFLKAVRFEDQLRELPPDVVVFGLGINDAHVVQGTFDSSAFELRYDSLVGIIMRVNPNAQFIWLTNNDALYKGSFNAHGILVQRAMYRLAKKHQGAVFDFFQLMGGYTSIQRWMAMGWARPDGIHLTSLGYQVHADWFASAITKAYLRHQETTSW